MQQVVMPFDGSTVEVIRNEAGEPFVVVKSVCDSIGVAHWKQTDRLKANPTFKGSTYVVPSAGGPQETYCLPLNQLNLWLGSINPMRTKEPVRSNLIAYQRECAEVLFKHFMPRGEVDLGPIMDRLTSIENVCRGFRDEIDELRSTLNLLITEDDEKMIRGLIRRIKDKFNCDGRTVVGKVRATLNVGSIYETPDTRKVINTLRNLLGEGLSLVKP